METTVTEQRFMPVMGSTLVAFGCGHAWFRFDPPTQVGQAVVCDRTHTDGRADYADMSQVQAGGA